MATFVQSIPTFSSFAPLWASVTQHIITDGSRVSPRGEVTREHLGFAARLADPRCRLLGVPGRRMNPFYLIGEWTWILRGSSGLSVVGYYLKNMYRFSDDGATLSGAYGPRIFGTHPAQSVNQLEHVIDKLRGDPASRQAVVAIYLPQVDWMPTRDVPCLTSLQFFIRDGRLHCCGHMRSQDVYLGMPYDVGWITLFQEYVAMLLGCELGNYMHNCGSIHLYEADLERSLAVLAEMQNWEPRIENHVPMNAIPERSQRQLGCVLELEEALRMGSRQVFRGDATAGLDGHWLVVGRVLLAFRHFKDGALDRANACLREIDDPLARLAERYLAGRPGKL